MKRIPIQFKLTAVLEWSEEDGGTSEDFAKARIETVKKFREFIEKLEVENTMIQHEHSQYYIPCRVFGVLAESVKLERNNDVK